MNRLCQRPMMKILSAKVKIEQLVTRRLPLTLPSSQQWRYFHNSHVSLFAKGNKKALKSKEEDDETEVEIALPNIKDVEVDMNKRIIRMNDEYSSLRGGRVSADMFNHLYLEAYGSKIALPDAGQVTMKTGSKVHVSVFDPDLTGAMAKAITECGMGLNPQIDGSSISVLVPKPSKEARESVVKVASKVAEKVSKRY